MSTLQKLMQVSWGVLLITIVASVGFTALYSAAGGSLEPWAARQMVRFAIDLVLMLAVARFAALLGGAENVRRLITRQASGMQGRRRYQEGTPMLKTPFETSLGAAAFMAGSP
jgi:hypothetical protein